MSALARACLRLSACAAIRGVTIADDRIYDSKIAPVGDMPPEDTLATVSVYTERDSGQPLSTSQGGPPFVQEVELVFELSMWEAEHDQAGQFVDVRMPQADHELVAALDTLEAQIDIALHESWAPLSVSFRQVAKRLCNYDSALFSDPKSGQRMASRYVMLKYELTDEPASFPADASVTGFDRLPEPFRTIAKAWPVTLPERATALIMCNALQRSAVRLLKGIDLTGTAPLLATTQTAPLKEKINIITSPTDNFTP